MFDDAARQRICPSHNGRADLGNVRVVPHVLAVLAGMVFVWRFSGFVVGALVDVSMIMSFSLLTSLGASSVMAIVQPVSKRLSSTPMKN